MGQLALCSTFKYFCDKHQEKDRKSSYCCNCTLLYCMDTLQYTICSKEVEFGIWKTFRVSVAPCYYLLFCSCGDPIETFLIIFVEPGWKTKLILGLRQFVFVL